MVHDNTFWLLAESGIWIPFVQLWVGVWLAGESFVDISMVGSETLAKALTTTERNVVESTINPLIDRFLKNCFNNQLYLGKKETAVSKKRVWGWFDDLYSLATGCHHLENSQWWCGWWWFYLYAPTASPQRLMCADDKSYYPYFIWLLNHLSNVFYW